ncbi:MAG: ribosome maturation factor [Bacteroidetes bacterium]|nr:MAG: ribosome maturation factor [Bacteroidota bacterium]PTM10756.1 MAG: ribosome maturation factor [Bacteroidota bacterium]
MGSLFLLFVWLKLVVKSLCSVEEKIIDLLEEKFAEPEFADCFWLDVTMHPNNRLEVSIDCDTGVTFAKCRLISRYLEAIIDEAGWLGEKYTLEVASPGTEKPLKQPRQYPKHLGRILEVKMTDGTTLEGRMTTVTEEHLVLEYQVVRKEGKKKITEELSSTILYPDIAEATVKLSFK